jgi:hypothetical protein
MDEKDQKIKFLEDRLLGVESAAHILLGEIAQTKQITQSAMNRLKASLEPGNQAALSLAQEIQQLRNLGILSKGISEAYLQSQLQMKQMFQELRKQLQALEEAASKK